MGHAPSSTSPTPPSSPKPVTSTRSFAGMRRGPLAGVLVAVKDNICTAEMPSTAGSRVLEGYTQPYDATTMRKIKELGGIVVGKTNLDEFGMGNTTEGSVKLWMSLDEFGQNHKFSEVVEMKDIWRMIPVAGFTSMEFSTGFE